MTFADFVASKLYFRTPTILKENVTDEQCQNGIYDEYNKFIDAVTSALKANPYTIAPNNYGVGFYTFQFNGDYNLRFPMIKAVNKTEFPPALNQFLERPNAYPYHYFRQFMTEAKSFLGIMKKPIPITVLVIADCTKKVIAFHLSAVNNRRYLTNKTVSENIAILQPYSHYNFFQKTSKENRENALKLHSQIFDCLKEVAQEGVSYFNVSITEEGITVTDTLTMEEPKFENLGDTLGGFGWLYSRLNTPKITGGVFKCTKEGDNFMMMTCYLTKD